MKLFFARIAAMLLCAVLLIGLLPAAAGAEPEPNAGFTITGSHYVARGKKITLKAGEAVTWKSSDKKIATVTKAGVVKGIKAGTAKITATSKSSGAKATWKITVKARAVTKVSINAPVTELNLKDRKTVTLKASAAPASAAQSFTWASSNPKVAKVSAKGKVTAVAKGTAKITAAAADGSGKKASVTIKVTAGKKESIKIGIITVNPDESAYAEKNVEDLKKTFTAAKGYDAEFFIVSGFNPDSQKNAFQDFLSKGMKYILLNAYDPSGWDGLLQDAKDMGVSVLLYDRMVDSDPELYTAAVVSSMKKEGELAVKWLADQKLPEYRVVHLQGATGSDAQIGRSAALTKKCKSDSGWTMVSQTVCWWDANEAYNITMMLLQSGESFNVLYAENDGMAEGAVRAMDEWGITHGIKGAVTVIGFDCNKWALEKLIAGEWNADVQCSPFQAAPLHRMIQTLEKGEQITGLNSLKQYINPEKVFDARTITWEDIEKYGLGPGGN